MTDMLSYSGKLVTIERFILDQQPSIPMPRAASPTCFTIWRCRRRSSPARPRGPGLAEVLGSAGEENVQGEEVQKLDVFAQRTIFRLNDHTGRLAVMASEEEEDIIPIPERFEVGKYVLLYDPLDGSSNIDVNVSVGTIFGIYRRKTPGGPRHAGRLPAARARPGGRRLHPLWREHDDGLRHGGRRRPRFHARPGDRRVPALASQYPLPRQAQVLQRQPGLPTLLDQGRTGLHGVAAGRHAREERAVPALHRLAWSPTSTATC